MDEMNRQIEEGRQREQAEQLEMFPDIPEVYHGVFFGEPTYDEAATQAMEDFIVSLDASVTRNKGGVVTFEEVFQNIFDEAFEILVERQKKYGPANVEKLGLYGIFTRIEDKMERLRHAFNGEIVRGEFRVTETDEASDESLDDGDFDAANYHLIRIALRRGLWGKPLEDDVVPE